MRVIFESHATTTDNEAGLVSGWNDVDLSEFGDENVRELRDRHIDELPDLIFCSDLLRSYKTGAKAFEGTGAKLVIDKRLRECDYGDLTQAPVAQVKKMRQDRILTPFPNGESFMDTSHRMKIFLDDLSKQRIDLVLIIGHRATQYGLEEHLNGRDLADVISAPWTWQPGWEYEL